MRPHHLAIEREKNSDDVIPAKVIYTHAVGPLVYVEMKILDTKEFVEAEISKEEFRELKLQIGEEVYVRPKEVRVFIPEDFVI